MTGMRGVYLVAAELSRLGLIASPTSRSAIGADILVTDQKCKETYSVQVKTNARTYGFWLLGAKASEIVSPQHIYVFVNLHNGKKGEVIEYYVVPSRVVARKMTENASRSGQRLVWRAFYRSDADTYRDKWSAFGVGKRRGKGS
jgi:hypothetical protein